MDNHKNVGALIVDYIGQINHFINLERLREMDVGNAELLSDEEWEASWQKYKERVEKAVRRLRSATIPLAAQLALTYGAESVAVTELSIIFEARIEDVRTLRIRWAGVEARLIRVMHLEGDGSIDTAELVGSNDWVCSVTDLRIIASGSAKRPLSAGTLQAARKKLGIAVKRKDRGYSKEEAIRIAEYRAKKAQDKQETQNWRKALMSLRPFDEIAADIRREESNQRGLNATT